MKKFELIKYAYDNYPKGLKITWPIDTNVQVFECSGSYLFMDHEGDEMIVDSIDNELALWNGKEWAEIVKPKIAVKVENEKEFKALMKYYDSLGWNHWNLEKGWFGKFVTVEKEYMWLLDGQTEEYQIIPFSDFAEQNGIKLPLLVSEDGVDLYEDDDYHEASYYEGGKVWQYVHGPSHKLKTNHRVYEYKEENKAFSTKQAALSWIEAQKPKETVLQFGAYKFTIKKDCVNVSHGDSDTFVDINSIYKAFLELN